jgi:hypothetical protein
MGGNAKKNLRMFRELCGESALKNVCIATTNWSRVTQDEGDMRERELRESPDFFKPLIDAGAQLVRWDKDSASAQSIVEYLLCKDQTKLQIQVEMDEGKTLEETGAGSILKEEITVLAEKHRVDMQALQKEIEEAAKTKQAELLAELEEERQKTEQQMLTIQEDLNKLKQQGVKRLKVVKLLSLALLIIVRVFFFQVVKLLSRGLALMRVIQYHQSERTDIFEVSFHSLFESIRTGNLRNAIKDYTKEDLELLELTFRRKREEVEKCEILIPFLREKGVMGDLGRLAKYRESVTQPSTQP